MGTVLNICVFVLSDIQKTKISGKFSMTVDFQRFEYSNCW